MSENRVVFVKAYFAPRYENRTVKVPTGETKRTWLGGEKEVTRKETRLVEVGRSDCRIDCDRLIRDIESVVASLNDEGLEVVDISPIISGSYNYNYEKAGIISGSNGFVTGGGGGWGYGYGYSFTEGIVVIARK